MKRFLFICMLGLFLITGCTVDNSLQQEVDQLSIPETIKPGYFLPESENSEITFAWEKSNRVIYWAKTGAFGLRN